MKIIKKDRIETWFSPRKYKAQYNEEIIYYLIDINNQSDFVHRTIGPAIISYNEKFFWYLYSFKTRKNGPSYIDMENKKQYYYDDGYYSSEEEYWNDKESKI